MKEPKENRLYLAIVLAYIAVSFLIRSLDEAELPLVLRLVAGELTLLIPTVLYILICRPTLKGLSERWKLPLAVIPLLILMAYCVMPLISVVNLISMMLAGENAVAPVMGALQRLPLVVSLLCVSVLPGVLEEFIFRGLLYQSYRKRQTWGAILASALLFGLMHMNLNQFCYAFVIGVLFCLVYEATGSVLAPMLMHMVYNGNSVVLTYLMDAGAASGATDGMTAEQSAQLLEQMMIREQTTWMITVIMLTVIGLIGLAAAGGLYVAVVKLCHREKQVLLLFQRDSWKKRMALENRENGQDENPRLERKDVSRKIGGLVFWLGVILSIVVILLDLFFS